MGFANSSCPQYARIWPGRALEWPAAMSPHREQARRPASKYTRRGKEWRAKWKSAGAGISQVCRTHLTTAGTSFFAAQTSAITHPITDQPRKRFSSRIAVVSRLLRAKAMIVGRKYIRKP